MRRHTPTFDRKAAESLAIQGLAFLAADVDRIGRFLALTGIEPAQIRASARGSGFLVAILEHFSADERLLIEFAAHVGRDPADLDQARTVLAGGDWERETA